MGPVAHRSTKERTESQLPRDLEEKKTAVVDGPGSKISPIKRWMRGVFGFWGIRYDDDEMDEDTDQP